MARQALLETFQTKASVPLDDPSEPAESWQSGFEAGYDKALQDIKEEQALLSAQIAQHLNDLAFGYHEARSHLERTLHPLFEQLVSTFVPYLARQAFVPFVSEALHDMARRLMGAPIQLRVAPEMEPLFRAVLPELENVPLQLVADSTLDDQQAILTGATEETAIDLQPLLQDIGSILGAMTSDDMEFTEHG